MLCHRIFPKCFIRYLRKCSSSELAWLFLILNRNYNIFNENPYIPMMTSPFWRKFWRSFVRVAPKRCTLISNILRCPIYKKKLYHLQSKYKERVQKLIVVHVHYLEWAWIDATSVVSDQSLWTLFWFYSHPQLHTL
jgi:hypothetical protein